MFKILKGGICYTPEYIGKKDVLIIGEKICKIVDISTELGSLDYEEIDCSGKIVCPGFIDQHVHITGGGGEEGPSSRIPELMLSDIVLAGVTTLVGVLGVDSVTRNIAGLLAKAHSLELEGISTFIYTGSYGVPTATLTGKVINDIAFIEKVIGVGEIAISDYRSSHPTLQLLKELANEAKVGGLIGAKAGVIHFHIGDGKGGLGILFELLEESDYPVEMFVPTHVNRNKVLFEQAIEFLNKGGHIDLTAGETSEKGYPVQEALELLLNRTSNKTNITVSSDGNGSMPLKNGNNGICRIEELFNDIRSSILYKKLDMTTVLSCVTSNVAKVLKIFPRKGALLEGSDADIVVLNGIELTIDKVIAKGKLIVKNGAIINKGRYEK